MQAKRKPSACVVDRAQWLVKKTFSHSKGLNSVLAFESKNLNVD